MIYSDEEMVVLAKSMGEADPECDNCGMIDVPLSDGYCAGCICLRCKKNAGEVGQSMTDMGFCDKCEAEIYL